MNTIQTIQIENFRGIRDRLTLALDGQNVIIDGENGTGKSSIVDALEIHFTGKIGRLTGSRSIKKNSIPNLQATGKPAIRLTYTNGQAISTTAPSYQARVSADLRDWYATAAKHPFILRRSQILQFIEAQPAKRYQQVSQLIGISDIEKVEKVWRDQMRRAKDAVQQTMDSMTQQHERLSGLLRAPVYSSEDCLRHVNRLLGQVGIPAITQQRELLQRQTAFAQRQLAQVGQAIDVEALHDLPDLAYAIGSHIETASTHYRTLLRELQAYWEISTALNAGELMPLLTAAVNHARQHNPTHCPICQQYLNINWTQHLERQLATLGQVQTAKEAVIKTQQGFEAARRQLIDHLTRMRARLRTIRLMEYDEAFEAALQVLSTLRQLTMGDLPAPTFTQPDTSALRQLYQQTLPLLVADLQERMAAPTLNERQSAELELVSTLPRIDELWSQLIQHEYALAAAERQHYHLQVVHDSLAAARKDGVATLLQRMEHDFQTFYTKLHPNEGYGDIRLSVIVNRRGSLDLETQFHNETAHPINFLSEGHLDSLGLCIFLAFIKQFNGAFRLIVLDDVLTSVDVTHRRRVVDLLATAFADYQLVLTTHSRAWAAELQEMLPNSQRLSLGDWQMRSGSRLIVRS